MSVRITGPATDVLDTLVVLSPGANVIDLRATLPEEGTAAYGVEVLLASMQEVLLEGLATVTLAPGLANRVPVSLYPVRPVIRTSLADTLAIRNVSTIQLTAVGDNPRWESYTWDLGDGSVGRGATISHVYGQEGVYDVSVTTTAGGTERSALAAIEVGTLAGIWVRDAVNGVRHRLEIIQVDNNLSGDWWVLFDPGSPFGTPADSSSSPLRGFVTSHLELTFAETAGCQRTIAAGSVTRTLTIIGGSGFYGNPACGGGVSEGAWRFRRVEVPGPVYSEMRVRGEASSGATNVRTIGDRFLKPTLLTVPPPPP